MALGANQGFPRQVRILKTDDFSSVFSLRKRIHGQFLVMHYAERYEPNKEASLRFAIVAAKKVSKLAVERNYIKRVMRELFRQSRLATTAQLPKGVMVDMIVRSQKNFTSHDFVAVQAEYADLMRRMLKRINSGQQQLTQTQGGQD